MNSKTSIYSKLSKSKCREDKSMKGIFGARPAISLLYESSENFKELKVKYIKLKRGLFLFILLGEYVYITEFDQWLFWQHSNIEK